MLLVVTYDTLSQRRYSSLLPYCDSAADDPLMANLNPQGMVQACTQRSCPSVAIRVSLLQTEFVYEGAHEGRRGEIS